MGFFPSFSSVWVPTKEDFVRDALPWLSFAKLRASYGQVGNDDMNGGRFAFLTLWGNGTESQIGNAELVWEKANKFNLGLETRLFSNFSLDADLFSERRNNILIPATVLTPTAMFCTGGSFNCGYITKINSGKKKN